MDYPNVFTSQPQADPQDPPGFHASALNLSERLAASELVVKLMEIEPGSQLCPYHYEYVEEWLVVIAGAVELRTPSGTQALETGAVVCFPVGPAGAHGVSCGPQATSSARVLMFSADVDPSVAVYPDSDKLAVYTHSGEDEVMVRRAEPSSHLGYYDGETP